MDYVIHNRQPERLFRHFEEISAIGRSSGHEKEVSDFLVAFAQEHNLEVYQDAIYNVIIKKPGSQGFTHLPSVMLQGHLDMVCEKNAATLHDFEREGIHLIQEGDLLRADGTTLGGDNGVAVAMMMAILEDDTLVHPPLECVFTVQEETGLAGAIQLDGEKLQARTMINLDSEEEGIATVSCAGGMRVDFSRACFFEPCTGFGLWVHLRGLLGGHSGSDIHLEHGNANKLLGRILYSLYENVHFKLCEINGGNKDNAIPREADALISLPNEAAVDAAIALIQKEAEAIAAELAEPGFCIDVEPAPTSRAMSEATTQALLRLLMLAPNGVQNRNVEGGGFVVRSLNLGVVHTEDGRVLLTFAPRSSVASLQELTKKELRLLGSLLDFQVEITSEYPGWAYAAQSPIREVFCDCYRELTGKELKCEAIHAGLECGLFCEKLPGLDAIAVGPDIRHCHTPDEVLDLSSFARTYELICAVLKRLTAC